VKWRDLNSPERSRRPARSEAAKKEEAEQKPSAGALCVNLDMAIYLHGDCYTAKMVKENPFLD
jgi:hypothetical protein